MAGDERHRKIVEAYERARREVAEHLVVDAAEDILGNVLVEHLAQVRQDAIDSVAVAAENRRTALRFMRAAQASNDPRQIACAQALLDHSERHLRHDLAEGRQTLADIRAQLSALSRAASERVDRRRADLSRLR